VISNIGKIAARAPFVTFAIPDKYSIYVYGIDGNGKRGFLGAHQGSDYRHPQYIGKETDVIQPDTVHDVEAIVYGLRPEAEPQESIEIKYEIAATGMKKKKGTLSVDF